MTLLILILEGKMFTQSITDTIDSNPRRKNVLVQNLVLYIVQQFIVRRLVKLTMTIVLDFYKIILIWSMLVFNSTIGCFYMPTRDAHGSGTAGSGFGNC